MVGNGHMSPMSLVGHRDGAVDGVPQSIGESVDLLLLTVDPHPESVLPSLALLAHNVRSAPTEVSSLLEAGTADVAIVDARTDLAAARGLCRLLGTTGTSVPVVAVVNEGGLVAVNVDWGLDEILLPSTGPAEIDARLRLLVGRRGGMASQESAGKVSLGELVIDEGTYTARLRGRPLDLTYKEFELLKYLAQHPGIIQDDRLSEYQVDNNLIDLVLSFKPEWWRIYGGFAYLFDVTPERNPWEMVYGLELTPWNLYAIHPVLGIHFHLQEEFEWDVNQRYVFGVEIHDWPFRNRVTRLLGEYYNGKRVEWPFYKEDDEYLGLGLSFDM